MDLPRDCWRVIGSYAGYYTLVAACCHDDPMTGGTLWRLLRGERRLWDEIKPLAAPIHFCCCAAIMIAQEWYFTVVPDMGRTVANHIARGDTTPLQRLPLSVDEVAHRLMPFAVTNSDVSQWFIDKTKDASSDLLQTIATEAHMNNVVQVFAHAVNPRLDPNRIQYYVDNCNNQQELKIIIRNLPDYVGKIRPITVFSKYDRRLLQPLRKVVRAKFLRTAMTPEARLGVCREFDGCCPIYIAAVARQLGLTPLAVAMDYCRNECRVDAAQYPVVAVLSLLRGGNVRQFYYARLIAINTDFSNQFRKHCSNVPFAILQSNLQNCNWYNINNMLITPYNSSLDFVVGLIIRVFDVFSPATGLAFSWLETLIGFDRMTMCKRLLVHPKNWLHCKDALTLHDIMCGQTHAGTIIKPLFARAMRYASYDLVKWALEQFAHSTSKFNENCKCGIKIDSDYIVDILAGVSIANETLLRILPKLESASVARLMNELLRNKKWRRCENFSLLCGYVSSELMPSLLQTQLRVACCSYCDSYLDTILAATPEPDLDVIISDDMTVSGAMWLFRRFKLEACLPFANRILCRLSEFTVFTISHGEDTRCAPLDLDERDNCILLLS